MQSGMVDVGTLARNWWLLLIRGIAAMLFGVLTFAAPGISLVVLVILFGAYAFVDGAFAIFSAIRQHGEREPLWLLVIEGIAGIGAGLVTFFYPGLTAIALLYLIAAWAVITGVLEIATAIRLRKVISNEWLLALGGILSVALGVVLMMFPGPGALAVVLWIGAYAILFGAVLIGLSLRLRSWAKLHDHDRPDEFGTGHPAQRPASV